MVSSSRDKILTSLKELGLECRQLVRVVVLQVLGQVPEDEVVVESLRFSQGRETPPIGNLPQLVQYIELIYFHYLAKVIFL